jgi:rod shape-determining protein MreC
MNRKRMLVVIVVGIVVVCGALIKDGSAKFPVLNNVVLTVMRPFNFVTNSVAHGLGGVANFFSFSKDVKAENEELKKENESLRKDNADLIGVKAENTRLTQLLNFKNAHPSLKLMAAKVISRDLGDFKDTILIDKGSNDGLKDNMSVITGSGLVGIIDGVYGSMSKVLLINSPKTRIGGMNLRGDSRVAGIVNGVAGSDLILEMRNMARNADLLPGDTIVTSGYSGYHPAGLIIGNIEEVQMDPGGLTKIVTIAPAVNFSHLEEVMVVTNYEGFAKSLAEEEKKQTANKTQKEGLAR